jgi:microcystin-dependent protein
MFACNFAPRGWAFCSGQLMPISQNTALFSLLGTYYGGDGKSTFALPNLQDSAPIGTGQSSTGTEYYLGQQSGVEQVTLLQTEIPVHTHTLNTASTVGDTNAPSPQVSLTRSHNATAYQNATNQSIVTMSPQAIGIAGGGLPHNNLQPYLTLNFCIALQGIYPQRP